MRRRLDAELVRRGLAESRTQARHHIEAGRVLVGGAPATKAARQVDAGEPVVLTGEPARFVGRGGEKLAGALDRFGLAPDGLRVLDAGASTGGFTDCLLQHGAREVVALDVGHGQLHERLRARPEVTVLERTNLRHVDPDVLGPFDAVVADLSFISLRTVMDVLVACTSPGGWLVLLVKPQFEAGRREASRARGVITDPEQWRGALVGVATEAEARGAAVRSLAPSPIRGAEGNVEFLLHLVVPTDRVPSDRVPSDGVPAGERQHQVPHEESPAPDGPSVEGLALIDAVLAEAVADSGDDIAERVAGSTTSATAPAGTPGASR